MYGKFLSTVLLALQGGWKKREQTDENHFVFPIKWFSSVSYSDFKVDWFTVRIVMNINLKWKLKAFAIGS